MIEREELHLPTAEEKLAFDRYERLYARMRHFGDSLDSGRDSHRWVYRSAFEGVEDFKYTTGFAKKAFGLAEEALHRSMTDVGLENQSWQKDWTNLLDNNLPQAPIATEEGVCSEGHGMLARSKHHFLCPCCGEVKWREPIK